MADQPRVIDTPVEDLVKNRRAAEDLRELGVHTVADLLRYYPRRYEEPGVPSALAKLVENEMVTVVATIARVNIRKMKRRRGDLIEVVVTDGTGEATLTFFNQRWQKQYLVPGRRGMFAGKVSTYRGKRQLTHPDYLLLDDEGEVEHLSAKGRLALAEGLIPIYPSTAKMRSWSIAGLIRTALDQVSEIEDPLPGEVRQRHGLLDLATALECLHRPLQWEDVEAARARLRYEEAFVLQAELARRRAAAAGVPAKAWNPVPDGMLAAFDERLPFELTDGQKHVGIAILTDLASSHPMQRLLQGDVGSGKTVVALRAMLTVVDGGGQTVLLAPTEVLAHQHYHAIRELLGPLAERGMLGGSEVGTRVALLTGSMGAKARREAMLEVASGDAGIVVGTHAVFQEKTTFADLGLVVIDEQHRFGVEQRAALVDKGLDTSPHVLVMTATPIPRTVAMTVFGDLEVCTLTEQPAGRQPIQSSVVPVSRPHWLDRAWQRVREEVAAGRQVYVVCPRIGDDPIAALEDANASADPDEADAGLYRDWELSQDLTREHKHYRAASAAADALELPAGATAEPGKPRPGMAVLDVAPMLSDGPLANLRLDMLHGRMAADAKEEVMRRFTVGAIDVLIATTVIEVGVDVPNATVMVIMDADRFGISQLHQLRGRVGRGQYPGLCLLVSDVEQRSAAGRRLEAVAATSDGFELSRVDLEQRREGDVLGVGQSGRRSSLRMLSALRDEAVIRHARDDASALVDRDPELATELALLRELDAIVEARRAEYLDKS